ncbi:GMC oxidoreductase [Paenibacillus sp. LHD-38]|uniref:GMC oxidoreductase n=1 Tax=Paenibacillus sp. LHD-38 TaxID=3072143 RepID=UPI00280FE469|nr:GMC oxidoreductase [Paenibacillus sp. LHD-38]MDQ8733525.1 GMC oxidoreductase [Paenibacillus sp. LHD-38]
MKIYLAHDTDTLRTISRKCKVDLVSLISFNSHIKSPDMNIAGMQVKLPDSLDFNEQWIPLTSLDEMEKTVYDVLIVGTGAGGGAVLWRLIKQLQNSGKRVGIVERGGLLLPTHAWNIATMNERFGAYFRSVADTPPQFQSPQVYALGGRTLFWSVASPRMPTSEIAQWPVTLKEMDFYYGLAEKALSVTYSFTKEASITQMLLNRLQMNGFPESTDEPLAIDLEQTKNGVIRSNPFFSTLVLFAQALNYPFDLAVNARAVKVLIEKDRAVGVQVMTPDKRSYFLKAKNVVLSASTLGSPQILLNSDIPGRAIGHYLVGHSRVNATGVVIRDEFPEVLGPLSILVPGTEHRPYQIQIRGPGDYIWVQYQEQPLKKEWEVNFYASGRVESRYENKVFLDPVKRDSYGMPELQIRFSYSGEDEIVIGQMAEGILKAASAMKVPLIERENGSVFSLSPPGVENHETGTCRMGDNPLTSATDRYGQIHGIRGLYVADNSVIPTSGTANPTLTTVALAIRTADYIVQQLK